MHINQRTDYDQRTENIPTPERTCAKDVRNASALELVADSALDLMIPNDRSDTECKPRENEIKQAIVHCLFAVISAGDDVDIGAD